jgi:hypothetical protein
MNELKRAQAHFNVPGSFKLKMVWCCCSHRKGMREMAFEMSRLYWSAVIVEQDGEGLQPAGSSMRHARTMALTVN